MDAQHKHSNKFTLLWRFIFLVELSKLVLRDESISPEVKQPLETFIEMNFPLLKRTPREYLKETVERKFRVSLSVVHGEHTTTSEEGVVNVLSFVHDLQSRLLSMATRGNRYIVIIDELDDTYDDTPEYYNILIGMFKAGMDLNAYFAQDYKALRVVMLLRSDIYSNLQYADKNKWSDMTHEINWVPDPDQTAQESDLFKLINLRVGVALDDEASDKFNYWNEVFTHETILSQLRPFQFMLSRSYYRPRDIIQFCKEVQEVSRRRREVKSFTKRVIKDAEYSYSQWFKDEIADELRVRIPFIEDVFEALSRHGQATFKAADINSQFQKFRVTIKLPVKSILQILFDFSVIGMFLDDDGEGGTPVFRFRDPFIEFREGRIYSVHYGLRPALRIGGRFRGGRSSK